MRKSIKMIAVTGAAVLGVATVGIGWAYYTEEATANAVNGQGADMAALVVTENPAYVYDNAQGLYPGHKGNVKIVVQNPNKVAVTVTKVTRTAESITGGIDSANVLYCEGMLDVAETPTFAGNGGGGGLVINPEASITLTLADAVSLKAETDNRCQGMVFSTQWKVESTNN